MSPKHQCFSGGGGCNVPPTIGLPRRWWVQCPPDTVGLQELVGAISPQHQGSPGGGGCNVPAALGLPARWRVQWSMPPWHWWSPGGDGCNIPKHQCFQEVVSAMSPQYQGFPRGSGFNACRSDTRAVGGCNLPYFFSYAAGKSSFPPLPVQQIAQSLGWTGWQTHRTARRGISHVRAGCVQFILPQNWFLSRPVDGHYSCLASRRLNTPPGRVLFVTPRECVLAVPRLAMAFGMAPGRCHRCLEEVSKKPGADRGSGPCRKGAFGNSHLIYCASVGGGLLHTLFFAVQVLLSRAGKFQMVIVTEDAKLSWPRVSYIYIYALYIIFTQK